jgi:hypothetical protein
MSVRRQRRTDSTRFISANKRRKIETLLADKSLRYFSTSRWQIIFVVKEAS